MVTYIIEHITLHFRSVLLLEITVRHRHMVLTKGIFRYHRFLPDYHGIFGWIILVKSVIGMLFLIIMDNAQGSIMLKEQASCRLQTVNNPSGRRAVRVCTYAPESPGEFSVHYEIRRFRHNLVELGSSFVHIGIPSVGTYDNKIIVERKPFI